MIKLIMCLHRRADISREQFQDYWLNKHGPFFQDNAATMRSRRYVQCHTIDSPMNDAMRASRQMQAEFDGVAEVWFESEQDLMEAMSTPEMQELGAALLEDEANFIDHSKSSAFIVREHEF